MEEWAGTLLVQLFRDIPDLRMVGKPPPKLHDVLVITVCAAICGLEHWTQIAGFGVANEAWFRTLLDLPNGIPSHDTFGKVSAALDPDAFERRIQQWTHVLLDSASQGKHIAIDGKTLRRRFDHASGKAAIHVNLARIRRISLLLLQQDKTCKLGVPSKRAKAAYDRDYLPTLLGFRRNTTAAT